MKNGFSSLPARPGTGSLVTSTPFGFIYTGRPRRQGFPHPFYPALSPGGLTLSRGMVSSIEPTIDGTPISGLVNGAQGVQPVLTLDPGVVAAGDNRSWACVEITVDSSGIISPKSTAIVAHRSTWFLQDPAGKTGRQPLCMILWNGQTPAQVYPIAYFNMTAVMAKVATTGAGVTKFFFL